jgi:hypothetical protein
MADLNMSIPFEITQDEALQRIKAAIAAAQTQYAGKVQNFRQDWDGNVATLSGTVMGQAISATVTVNPAALLVRAPLPGLASFFKGKIESAIQEQAEKVLKA